MKKWIISIVVAAVAIVIFCGFYANNNAKFEKITINQVVGEANNKTFKFNVLDKKILNENEIKNAYDISGWGDCYEEKFAVVVIDVEITNITEAEQLLETYAYELTSLGWANGVCAPLYQQMNEEDSAIILKAGETITLSLPFFLLESHFKESTWNDLEQVVFSYIISKYPIRTEIQI